MTNSYNMIEIALHRPIAYEVESRYGSEAMRHRSIFKMWIGHYLRQPRFVMVF